MLRRKVESPVTLSPVTVRSALPGLAMLSHAPMRVPTATFPKATATGDTSTSGVPSSPVPVNETSTVGVSGSLLAILMVPVSSPAPDG